MDAGMLPSAAFGGGLAVGLDAYDRLHVELSGSIFASQETKIDVDRGATFSLVSGGARACWALTRGISFAPCLGAEIVRVTGKGFGAARVSEEDAWTVAPEAAFTLRVPITRGLALRAGLGALVPVSRRAFVIAPYGALHEPSPVAVRAFLGPEVHF
jgi:hypothetical protein